jgi:hypothetical protein
MKKNGVQQTLKAPTVIAIVFVMRMFDVLASRFSGLNWLINFFWIYQKVSHDFFAFANLPKTCFLSSVDKKIENNPCDTSTERCDVIINDHSIA